MRFASSRRRDRLPDELACVVGTDQRLDPEIASLANASSGGRRMRTELDPECDAEYMDSPRRLGKVSIRFRRGTISQAKVFRLGTSTNPLTNYKVEAQFFSWALHAVSEPRAKQIIKAVNDLENQPTVRELTKRLVAREVS